MDIIRKERALSIVTTLNSYPFRRLLLSLIILGGFGFVRIPMEMSTEQMLKEQGFRDWSPSMSAREQLTQASFVGSVGGFRSLIASIYDLRAHQAFRDKDWASVEKFRGVTTSLQPRFAKHWDLAAWDLAWNAYAYYRNKSEWTENGVESWQMKNIMMPRYLEKGLEFAKQGAEWVPESYRLAMVVGDIYSQKYNDSELASQWYLKSSQADDAPPYVFRAYATHLARCEGKEEEAYEVTSSLYRSTRFGTRALTLTVRRDMERLEDHIALSAANAMSLEQLENAALSSGSTYLDHAKLGMHLLEVKKDSKAALAVYRDIVNDKNAPFFYSRKLLMLLARNPANQEQAYEALKKLLKKSPEIFRRQDVIEFTKLETILGVSKNNRKK
ncbi:hypothetical protein OAG39_02620 [Verrucomicrobiales bacterium]|nr:hypothetical protein [Verrucomicrobiales bacterium]